MPSHQQQQKSFNRSEPGLSMAEKKRCEDRQQWLLMGGGLGGVVILIGGFLLYAIFARPDSNESSSSSAKIAAISPTPTTPTRSRAQAAVTRSRGSGGSSATISAYYGTSLDKRSIAEASAYKNRRNPGRLKTNLVTLSRSAYTAKIENRREKEARIKRIEAVSSGDIPRYRKEKQQRKQSSLAKRLSKPQKGLSAEQRSKQMEALLSGH